MRNQKLKRMLGAAVLFILFSTGCRAGWDGFNEEIGNNGDLLDDQNSMYGIEDLDTSFIDFPFPEDDPFWNGEFFNSADLLADQQEQPAEHIPEASMAENAYTPLNIEELSSTAGPSTQENLYITGQNTQENLYMAGPSMAENVYTAFNPEESAYVAGTSMADNNCMAGSSMTDSFFNDAYNRPSTSREEYRMPGRVDDIDFILRDFPEESCFWDSCHGDFGGTDGVASQYNQPMQYTPESNPTSSTSNEKDKKTKKASRKKKTKTKKTEKPVDYPILRSLLENKKQRKKRPLKQVTYTDYQQEEIEKIINENIEIIEKKSQEKVSYEKTTRIKTDQIDFGIWNAQRLSNIRRRDHKLKDKNVYSPITLSMYINGEFQKELFQKRLRKSIEDFSAQLSSEIEKNALWYFIASGSTNITTKYKDLLGIREIFRDINKTHKEMIEGLRGYYPGVIDDMIAYLENHQPMRIIKSRPQAEWKESLGDIHIREYFKPNYYILEGQKKIKRANKKHSALICAMRMVLMIPEVYQDFLKISPKFIEASLALEGSSTQSNNCRILLEIHDIVHICIEENENANLYNDLYDIFEEIYGTDALQKLTAVDLYREIYTALSCFYERAMLFDEQKYVLAGKCMITNQRYIKCEVKVRIASNGCEERAFSSKYSLEKNRWSISSNVHEHYHVYYVDSTTHQLRKLCMPMHVEGDKKYYLHTIGDTVEHIKKLYETEAESDEVHPFKVNRKTKKWSYIKKNDRQQTVQDLAECDVVFYRIEERLKRAKFTFAEFNPKNSQNKDSILIPLFLTPLMQSAVELGPFVKAGKHKEMKSVEFKDKEPDVYDYNDEYNYIEYSDVHKYYSDLYIVPAAKEKRMLDCYFMDCKTAKKADNTVEAVWYVRMPDSVDVYTHCVLDGTFRGEENTENLDSFVETIEPKEHNKEDKLQGFWLNSNEEGSEPEEQPKTIYNLHPSRQEESDVDKKSIEYLRWEINKMEEKFKVIEDMQIELGKINKHKDMVKIRNQRKVVGSAKIREKNKLQILYKELLYKKVSKELDCQAEFVVFRRVNESKSILGAHNEILDVLISRYNLQR